MKIVGKRKPANINLDTARGFLKMMNVLRKGKPFFLKGVHRFETFEESDTWSLKMMTRNYNPERPKLKIL